MITTFNKMLGLGLASALVASSGAQVLTSRFTRLNYNYVYGAGGDSHVGGDTYERNTLLASDTIPMSYQGSTFGSLPGEPPSPYTAGVNCDLSYDYSVTGPLNNFTSINANHNTHVDSSATGVGVALMNSTNPGNATTLEFTMARPTRYSLAGQCVGSDPYSAEVTLRHFDGFSYALWDTTIFLPSGLGLFNFTRTMPAGPYRLYSATGLNSQGTWKSSHCEYSFGLLPNHVFISGTVNLGDFVGSVAGEVVQIELRAFNGSILDSIPNVTLTNAGAFSVSTAIEGNAYVRVRGRTWCAQTNGYFNLVAGNNSAGVFNLDNGDADHSGEVDAADIDQVIAGFGGLVSQPGYDIDADLDGSGEVDAADIDITIANFGALDG